MARMRPPRFPYPDDPRKRAEKRFFMECQRQLGNEWIVLYEQEWFGERNGRKQSGEADFVMLNADYGVFVVEVKGGQVIGIDNGEWYTIPHGTSDQLGIKNPFRQAAESKFSLWQYIRKNVPQVHLKGELGHMVVFPGHRQQGDISPQARRVLICDRDDLTRLQETMGRVARQFNQQNTWTGSEIELLSESLMPSFELIGHRRAEFDDVVDQLSLLTDVQLKVFAQLRKQRRLNVHGTAGSGKTLLAFHRAKELALSGNKVLFLCHSDMLAVSLRAEVARSHGEIRGLVIQSQLDIWRPFSEVLRIKTSERYSFADYCLALLESESGEFDAIVIDEAQSIRSTFADVVARLASDGFLYVFGDPNQFGWHIERPMFSDDYNPDSLLDRLGQDDPYELNLNCRSTVEVANFARRLVGSEFDAFGSSFLPVEILESSRSVWGSTIETVVARWQKEFGIKLEDIAIVWESHEIISLVSNDELNESLMNEIGFFEGTGICIDWLNGTRNIVGLDQLARYAHFNLFLAEYGIDRRESRFTTNDLWNLFFEWNRKTDGYEWRRQKVDEIQELRAQHHAGATNRVLPAVSYNDFIGLESPAVIAILPHGAPGEENCRIGFHKISYTMATRARLLLAVIGDQETLRRINEPS